MSKKLVAYFSASGVTAAAAKTLAEAAGADLYEIKPETPYTNADLNWNNKQSRSSVEMNDPAFRPAIADRNANVADYDVVFVGFPIWWYVAPTIGKTIVPFATSGGSGLGKTVEKLRSSVSETAVWKEGKLLNGRLSADAIASWLKGLGV